MVMLCRISQNADKVALTQWERLVKGPDEARANRPYARRLAEEPRAQVSRTSQKRD